MEAPKEYDLKAYPTCKICDRGTLMPRKIRRLSGPAVAIGYILLIPSILGMTACAILLVISLLASVAGAAHDSAFATAFAGTWSIAMVSGGIGCFVFGLLGWLLIMKKDVLQCGYCGAVVNAVSPIFLQAERRTVSVRNVIGGVLFILGITIAIWAFVIAKTGTQTSTPSARIAEQVQPIPDNSTAEQIQPVQNNSIAEPTRSDAMQPFTSTDARFSVMFPGVPEQSLQPFHTKNGETATLYVFSVTAENGNTWFAVKYINYPADYVNGYPADNAISDPQVRLQAAEKGDAAGKTLFRDQDIDLDGVPGRDYAIMLPDGRSCTVHEYLAGNRLYQLFACTAKDYLPNDQGYQFLHSFRIF